MSQFNRIWLYAIVPAFIAGFFAIAPKIYDVVTEPKSELVYRVTEGPGLDVGGDIRKIYAVQVISNGKKAISDVQAELRFPKGKIQQFKIEDPSGIKPTTNLTNDTLYVNARNMHPTENFVISAMVLMPLSETGAVFNLRSKEVLGKIKLDDGRQKRNARLDILGALLAGGSVFFMLALTALGRGRLATAIFGRKQDILYYIVARLGLKVISNEVQRFGADLSYLRMADILLSTGLSDEKLRQKAVTALKCMLMIEDIAPTSLKVVKNNIQAIEKKDYAEEEINDLREKSVTIWKYMRLRDTIEQYIDEKSGSVETPDGP